MGARGAGEPRVGHKWNVRESLGDLEALQARRGPGAVVLPGLRTGCVCRSPGCSTRVLGSRTSGWRVWLGIKDSGAVGPSSLG